jgi:hypothetical protein
VNIISVWLDRRTPQTCVTVINKRRHDLPNHDQIRMPPRTVPATLESTLKVRGSSLATYQTSRPLRRKPRRPGRT